MTVNPNNLVFNFKKLFRYFFCFRIFKRLISHKNLLRILPNQRNYKIKKNIVSYRLYDGYYHRLKGLELDKNYPLLSDKLIQSPSKVIFENKVYDLTAPGVYRFYRLNDISEQRIVSKGDFNCLLKSLGYLYSYGFNNQLNYKSFFESNIMKKQIPVFGCNDISKNISLILNQYGIENRLITFFTRSEWDGHDDGHTLIEVNNFGKWFLYDPSFLSLPLINRQLVSAIDLQKYLYKSYEIDIDLKPLSGNKGHSQFKHSNYDYGFWVDEKYHSKDNLISWYKHIFGAAIYCDKSGCYFSEENLEYEFINRLISLDYKPISNNEIINRFYNDT